ncbi:MAG: hypothetical protein KAI66_21985, partial [Lentisphaeria bacterium]|nr:hypothetical protein [Lentisphaeria bacterium]
TLFELWMVDKFIHGAIEPAHILITPKGRIKLIGFSSAAMQGAGYGAGIYGKGVHENPHFICPEQILGQPLDHRSDLYSLGATCYYMLTGSTPFDADTNLGVASLHLSNEPVPPAKLVPTVSRSISDAVMGMLAKAPEDRPQSGAVVHATLKQAMDDAKSVEVNPVGDMREAAQTQIAPPAVISSDFKVGFGRWLCPMCGTKNGSSADFCSSCGRPVLQPCPFCEEEVHASEACCPHCQGDVAGELQGATYAITSILDQFSGAITTGDTALSVAAVRGIRERGVGGLTKTQRGTFDKHIGSLVNSMEKDLDQARKDARLDLYETAVDRLTSIIGSDGAKHYREALETVKTDLANHLYQANAAFQTNCLSRCLELLGQTEKWTGSIADRREELFGECGTRALARAQVLGELDSIPTIVGMSGDLGETLVMLTRYRLSEKLLVVTPAPEDVDCEHRLQGMLDTLRKAARTQVLEWVAKGDWKPVAAMQRSLRTHAKVAVVTRFSAEIDETVAQAIEDMLNKGRTLERDFRVREAQQVWERVCRIPNDLVPVAIRQFACEFPTRKRRLIQTMRKPKLALHISSLLVLWVAAFAFAAIAVVMKWVAGDSQPSPGELTVYITSILTPMILEVLLLVSGWQLLRAENVMYGDDLSDGLQAPTFDLILCLLWVLSPAPILCMELLWLVFSTLDGADSFFASSGFCGALLIGLWFLADHLRKRPKSLRPERFALTISWTVGAIPILWIWKPSIELPLQTAFVSLAQALVFVGIQAGVYYHRHRRISRAKQLAA